MWAGANITSMLLLLQNNPAHSIEALFIAFKGGTMFSPARKGEQGLALFVA